MDPADATPAHTVKDKRRARERYPVVILLCAVDRGRSGGQILQELRNDALKGKLTFPSTLAKAMAMVNEYSAMASAAHLTSGYEGVAFMQEVSESSTSRT